jgi:hypothetical protein
MSSARLYFNRREVSLITRYQIRVITKLQNTEQSSKEKVKTHISTNRQNQSTTRKQGCCIICPSIRAIVLSVLLSGLLYYLSFYQCHCIISPSISAVVLSVLLLLLFYFLSFYCRFFVFLLV